MLVWRLLTFLTVSYKRFSGLNFFGGLFLREGVGAKERGSETIEGDVGKG